MSSDAPRDGRGRNELLGRHGERPDGLEGREREQGQQRELHACERAGVDGRRGDGEHRDGRQHRERGQRALGHGTHECRTPASACERSIGGVDACGRRICGAVGDELRRGGERIEQLGRQLGACRRLVPESRPGERDPAERHDDAGEQQEEREHDAGDGQRDDPDDDRHRSGEQRDGRRAERAQVQALERVDVGDEAAQEVARAEAGKPGGHQRLEPGEEPDAERRQRAQRGVVRDQALEVAKHPARDPEEADRDDHDAELEDRRVQRGPRDQVARGRHQADAGADRERPEQDAERQPARLRTCEPRHAHERDPEPITRSPPRPRRCVRPRRARPGRRDGGRASRHG